MNEKESLPEGWRWVRLGEVCNPTENRNPKTTPDRSFRYVDISSVDNRSKKIIEARTIIGKDAPSRARQIIRANDIIVATTRPNLNAVVLVPKELDNEICSTGFCVLRPTGDIEPLFLFAFVQSRYFIDTVSSQGQVKGTIYPAVTDDQVRAVFLPLPPLPEQRRIAAKLQELMREVECARTACEKQLGVTKALPAAYLCEVFESEEAKKWEKKRLGQVCEVFSGSSAPQEEKYFKNGKYPFVRVQDLGRYGKTTNLTVIKDYINDIAIKEVNLVKAGRGTILFPKSGAAITTNNRAILGTDAYIVSHLAAIKPKDKIADTFFVYYWLCMADMVNYMENPGYPSLKLSTVSKITIPLPSLENQHRIAPYLKEKISYAEKLRTSIEKQLETINALPQAILRKAFRGEL